MPTPPAISATRGRRRAAVGERPERALDDHARARPDRRRRSVKSPSALDRDPQAAAVGRGARARTGAPPTSGRGSGSASSRTARRARAGRSSRRRRSRPRRRPAPPRRRARPAGRARRCATSGTRDPADDERARGWRRRAPSSTPARAASPTNVGAGLDLVAEGERDRQVCVQVHELPRLVAQPPPDGDDRRDHHGDEERQPGDRGEHARVAGDQPRRPRPTARSGRRSCSRRVISAACASSSHEARARVDPVPVREPLEAERRSRIGIRASSSSATQLEAGAPSRPASRPALVSALRGRGRP